MRRPRSTASASLRTSKVSQCSRHRASNPLSWRRWLTCCRWDLDLDPLTPCAEGYFHGLPVYPVSGLLSCALQGRALHSSALVLHHHLQCGQTADEEQAAREGERPSSSALSSLLLWNLTKSSSCKGVCAWRWAGKLLQGVWCRHPSCRIWWKRVQVRWEGHSCQAVWLKPRTLSLWARGPQTVWL